MANLLKSGAKLIGKSTVGLGKSAIKTTVEAGASAYKNKEAIAKGAVNATKKTGSFLGKTAENTAKLVGPEVRITANRLAGLGDALITENAENLSGIQLSKLGVAAAVGSMAIGKTREGIHDMTEANMGVRDGQIRTATPSYVNNAGATGDLVFALNNKRRG